MRLEIKCKEKKKKEKKTEKQRNTWRLNNVLLNNQCITEGIKQEIKNTFRQMKWNDNAKLLNTTEAALHGKFIKAYLTKQEKKQAI